jgi:hypothetical protein
MGIRCTQVTPTYRGSTRIEFPAIVLPFVVIWVAWAPLYVYTERPKAQLRFELQHREFLL